MTCIQQALLFTGYEENLDNQLRRRHQPKSCWWLSAGSHCGYTSSLLCGWASAFWNLPRAPIRVTSPVLVAVSRPVEHKLPMALRMWCPRLLCWSAHRLTSLVICSGYFWLCIYSASFSGKSCMCQWHFDRAHNRVALIQFSPYLGFLVSWWVDVMICHKSFCEVGFF